MSTCVPGVVIVSLDAIGLLVPSTHEVFVERGDLLANFGDLVLVVEPQHTPTITWDEWRRNAEYFADRLDSDRGWQARTDLLPQT